MEQLGQTCAALVLAAAMPPHLRHPEKPLQNMQDAQLQRWFIGLAGLRAQDEMLNKALFDLVKDGLHSDVRAFENHSFAGQLLRHTPTLCVSAIDDQAWPVKADAEWCRYIHAARMRRIEGRHQFVTEKIPLLAELLSQELL
jgi:surfactin synthase thioesterase subunit